MDQPWQLGSGIAYPPHWIDRFGPTAAIEHGTWISYLDSELSRWLRSRSSFAISHPAARTRLIASLKHEQSEASGERASDVAYALAVFGTEYHRNRDYLLQLLETYLSRPKDSAEDDVCDGKLLRFLTNWYSRGDGELLQPALRISDSRRDVIYEIGYFYGDLLERHTAAALIEMSMIVKSSAPASPQMLSCFSIGRATLGTL